MAENNQQGSGKHPHKSSGESHSKNEQSGASSQKSGGGANDDLKSREYKDNQGNVHHHTHTAKDQGGKE